MQCVAHRVGIVGKRAMQIGVETSRAVENKRIFAVSADDITRTALQFMLHDENEAHEFADVNSAYAKAAQWKPDLLILGQEIVEAQGLGVLQEIGARLPGAKIMLAVEAGQEAAARSYLEAGVHGLLVKPLTVEGVRRAVDGMLGRGDKPAAGARPDQEHTGG